MMSSLLDDRWRQAVSEAIVPEPAGLALHQVGDAVFRQLAADPDLLVRAAQDALRRTANGRIAMQPTQGLLLTPRATSRTTAVHSPGAGAAGVVLGASGPAAADQVIHVVLLDRHTARPRAVVGGAWLAPAVAAASTVVAGRWLARPDADTLAVVGCVPATLASALALSSEFPLRVIRVYDEDERTARLAVHQLAEALGIPTMFAGRPSVATEDAALVLTGTPGGRPQLSTDSFEPGCLVCALDGSAGMREPAWDLADRHVSELPHDGPRATESLAAIVGGQTPARSDPASRMIWLHRPHPAVVLAVAASVERLATDRRVRRRPAV